MGIEREGCVDLSEYRSTPPNAYMFLHHSRKLVIFGFISMVAISPPDFLSSLEVMLIDQLDCLTMQNWAHLTHMVELCNVLPKEANGADFARIREYCLDG
jgi:hypothetical protein